MNFFKQLRAECGLTQVEMAKLLGVSTAVYVAWEVGRRAPSPWLYPMFEHYARYRLSGGEHHACSEPNPMRSLVRDSGLTQAKFSEATKIPKRTIENWCSLVNQPPKWLYSVAREWMLHTQKLITNDDIQAKQ